MLGNSHLSPTELKLLTGKPPECGDVGACACELFFSGIEDPDQLGKVDKLKLATRAVNRDMGEIAMAGCPKGQIIIVDTKNTPAILKVEKTIWR